MKYATILAASLTCSSLSAAIVVQGADGSDGVLNITADTTIDLGLATTGTWDANNAANAGKGIYDAGKWAVIFKYSSVTVAAGKTLIFKNHASRAPVVWLVSGNVTLAGTVSMNGQVGPDGNLAPNLQYLAEPGPGGFRGGAGYYNIGAGIKGSAGFGVGGGDRQNGDGQGYGGSYGSKGQDGPDIYGNPSLLPLVGGSGGAGASFYPGGGGGGGALLVACANTISVMGEIRANGGNAGPASSRNAGSGSGGGVRLIAASLSGNGIVQAIGGSSAYPGGLGRIRLERAVNSSSITISPDPSVVPVADGSAALLWPPTEAPQVRVVSIGGASTPTDPRASFGSAGADVSLAQTATTPTIIETTNVEQASQVQVRVTPRSNGNATVVNATVQSVVSITPLVVRWTATLPVNVGYSAVQVKVVRP